MRLPLPVARAVVRVASRPLGHPTPVRLQRAWFELLSGLSVLPAGTSVEPVELAGRPAERIAAPGADGSRAVLLLHGGAFLTGSPRTHRVFAAHLSAAAGAPVLVLDYRRAPEHAYPAAVTDARAAYGELAEQGLRVSVVGDSAGGGLALLLALQLRDEAAVAPEALVLVSPVVDFTLATSDAYRGADAVVRRSWLRHGVHAFVGSANAAQLSPLQARLSGLPPVLLHLAGEERLRPEGELLAERLRAEQVDTEVEVLPQLWHDAHLQAQLVEAAADAVARAGQWLLRRSAAQAGEVA